MRVRKACLLLVMLAAASLAVVPSAAENLLTNGDFETGPYGSIDVPGWTAWTPEPDPKHFFDGVFDAMWNVPPTQPNWPSNYGAYGGSHFLARYYRPSSPSQGWINGALYQRLTGLTPGQTLYAQLWTAAHHPHGPAAGCGARIGLDPAFDPAVDAGPTAATVWNPEMVNEIPTFGYTESAYGKLKSTAQVGEAGTMTVWVHYQMADNDISEPQVVQVDDVRLATTKAMEIKSIYITGSSTNVANITWETADGAEALVTDGYVDYGLSPSYGSTRTDAAKSVHSVNLTGLTPGATYHIRIRSSAAGYEEAQTADITFTMAPSVRISNVTVTATTGDTATIEWDTTDTNNVPLPADSRVEYGYGPTNYQFSSYDATLTSHHSVTLTGLYPNTKYYYRVESSAPDFNSRRYPTSTTVLVDFTTGPGQFWNGDFETVLLFPRGIDDEIPGWSKVQGRTQWFNNGEWGISLPGGGGHYVGNVTNYDLKNGVLAQRFTTTPGEVLSFTCWVWSEGTGDWKQTPCGGQPHRFGEDTALIGIDPTGGTDPYSNNVVWSAQRQTQDWRYFSSVDPCTKHSAEWQKIGVATVAKGDTATVFLKSYNMWGIGWAYNVFDNVAREPLTPVSSVTAAKELPNDTPISLAGATAFTSPVVTYIANPNNDIADNQLMPYFYIQDASGAPGIKVTMAKGAEWPEWLAVGKRVNLKGCITWGVMRNRLNIQIDQQYRLDKPCGERVISAFEVTDTGATGSIEPLGVGNREVAAGSSTDPWFTNAGADKGVGVNTTGMLVRTWGKVTGAYESDDGACYIVIDDGSAVTPFSLVERDTSVGLCVYTGVDDRSDLIGRNVCVTGIAGVRVDYDWDDPSYVPGVLLPEAGKNVRWLKPLIKSDDSLDIEVIE